MAEPSFKDLPEELVSNIALRLWSDDIQALRLTCKDLEAKTLHDFATEYFSEKAFIISSDSLKVLVGIADSPKLRGFLHRIDIITAYFSDTALTCSKKCPYGHCCGWRPTVRQREAWKFLMQDAKHLKASGRDKDMLTDALRKLPALKHISVVDTTAAVPIEVDIRMMRKVARLCGRNFQVPCESKVDAEYLKVLSHIWSILTTSIADSGITTLKRFGTGLAKGSNSLCVPLDIRFSESKINLLKTAFQNLEGLGLHLTTRVRRGASATEKQTALKPIPQRVQKFTSIFSRLQTLTMDFESTSTDNVIFKNIMQGLDLSVMKKLHLHTLKTDRTTLMGVFNRLPAMHEVFLTFVDLVRGSWIPVLKQLQGMDDRLDHLHLMYVSESGKKVYFLAQPDEDEQMDDHDMFYDDLLGDQDDPSDDDLPSLEAMGGETANLAPTDPPTTTPLPATVEADHAPPQASSSSASFSSSAMDDKPSDTGTSKSDAADAHGSADHKAPGNESFPERGYYVCISGKKEINKQLKTFVQEYNIGEYVDADGPPPGMMLGGPMGGGMGGAMAIPVPVGNGQGPPPNMNNFLNSLAGAFGLPPMPGQNGGVGGAGGGAGGHGHQGGGAHTATNGMADGGGQQQATGAANGPAANPTTHPNTGNDHTGAFANGGIGFGTNAVFPPAGIFNNFMAGAAPSLSGAGGSAVVGASMDDEWDTAQSSDSDIDTEA